jgi:YD repeat-containing protein
LLIKGRLLDKKRHPATRRSAGGAITKPAGETIYFVYDVLGRLASKDVPNVRPYEADVSYGYDNLGALTSTSDGLGHVQIFEHDVHGNLLAEHSNWYGSVRSQYDHAGRRTRLTWPDGFFVSYEHRVTGEMAAIRENGGTVLASFSYDELGRRASIARGNGTVTTYGYDAASRLAALTQELAGPTTTTPPPSATIRRCRSRQRPAPTTATSGPAAATARSRARPMR